MYYKDFDTWNNVKKRINKEDRKTNIRAGEVRWVSIGVNVGSEIDGKGVSFTRPALIVNLVGTHLALIIPMSSRVKDIPGYLPIELKGKEVALCIHQMKVISQKRIFSRIGKLSNGKMKGYKSEIIKFFGLQ